MADYLERGIIQRDARLDTFSPGFAPPSDTNVPAAQAAVNFQRRLRSAMEDIAYDIVVSAITTPPAPSGTENDQLIWSNKVLNGEIDPSSAALRLVLAEFDAVAPADLASVSDIAIKEFFVNVVPILARDIRK